MDIIRLQMAGRDVCVDDERYDVDHNETNMNSLFRVLSDLRPQLQSMSGVHSRIW